MATFFRNFGRANVKDSHTYGYHLGNDNNKERTSKSFTIDECTPWVGRRALVNLKKFRGNTVGTIKYIGMDPQGVLCAGIEFDTYINGMSGKVNGQKLFKCQHGHGLLVPVERVILMDNGSSGSRPPTSSSALSRTKSMPNITRNNESSDKTWNLAIFTPEKLPFLNIGDNVVWMGANTPATGIVKWIGREGRNAPVKVWLEMDEIIGYGNAEQMFCVNFNCERGRGRFLPVEELMLLSDFLPEESAGESSNKLSRSVSTFDASAKTNITDTKPSDCAVGTLIDLFDTPNEATNISGADAAFFAHVPNNNNIDNNSVPDAASAVVNDPFVVNLPENIFGPSAPLVTPTSDVPHQQSTNPFRNPEPGFLVQDNFNAHNQPQTLWNDPPARSTSSNGTDGVTPTTNYGFTNPSATETPKISPPPPVSRKSTSENKSDYLPSFIVPPINIHEFYKTRGSRGIQGNRNSCYIDVVLFSMFGFTNAFDSRLLEDTGKFNNHPETEVTRLTRKILAENIVNPLRSQFYCSSEGVTKLREVLVHLSNKLDGAFMDVEEFMLMLFDKVYHLEEFIHYDIDVKDYMHQINLGSNSTFARVDTVGTCLKHSMAEYKLKFKCVPTPAFIVQMPRMAGNMVQDAIIVPTLTLNIDNLMSQQAVSTHGTTLNLLAVICIHDHHYTAFVKCGEGALSHWVYYDSNPSEGFPKIEILPKMGEWLEDLERTCNESPTTIMHDRHKYHPMLQSLLSNAYVCIYYSPEAVMRETYQYNK